MIKTDAELQRVQDRKKQIEDQIAETIKTLSIQDVSGETTQLAVKSLQDTRDQLDEEEQSYLKLKRGIFPPLISFDQLGPALISLRIASGVSQAELANRLGTNASIVSRDEKNEYGNITVERVQRILSALNISLTGKFKRLPVVVPIFSEKPMSTGAVSTPSIDGLSANEEL